MMRLALAGVEGAGFAARREARAKAPSVDPDDERNARRLDLSARNESKLLLEKDSLNGNSAPGEVES